MKRIAVIGGGIGGLTCAYALRRLDPGADVMVLEAGSAAGGKVRTLRRDGFVIEAGPDAFLQGQPEAVDLCRELGLGDALVSLNSENSAVYILVNNKLLPIPTGLHLVAPTDSRAYLNSPLLSWPARLRAALEPRIPARSSEGEETIGAFVTRRLGRQVTERLAQPLLGGIYGGDVDRLSLRETFPELAAMEREHGSLTRGVQERAARMPASSERRSAFVSLAGGLDTLVAALTETLGDVVRTGQRVIGLADRRTAAGAHYGVLMRDGTHHDVDEIVLATSAPAAVSIVHPLSPHMARGLAQLSHVSTAVVSLGFRERDVGLPLDGYGFLVASRDGATIRGCTWSSSKLPGRAPSGHVLLRTFLGGADRDADVARDDDDLVAMAMEALRQPLKLSGEPVLSNVDRWPQAQPQYEVGYRERVNEIRGGCPPGLHLIGASYDGVGLPAVIRSARKTAHTIGEGAAMT